MRTLENLDLAAMASAPNDEKVENRYALNRKISDTNGNVSRILNCLPGLGFSRPGGDPAEAARYDRHVSEHMRIAVSPNPDVSSKPIALYFVSEADKYKNYAEYGIIGAAEQSDSYMKIVKKDGYSERNFKMEIDGLVFVRTCAACPEQYDVFQKQNGELGTGTVGYVRLRYGHLSCDYPDVGGEVVYDCDFDDEWKGDMTSEEREEQLAKCAEAINRKLADETDDW